MKSFFLYLKRNNAFFLMLATVTGLFFLLYRRIIFGGYLYAYEDIGRDTIATYFPNMLFNGEWLRGNDISGYSLQFGFGSYIQNPALKSFFPFELVLCFCNFSNINTLLLVSLYIKIILLSLFSYLYLKKMVNNEYVAALAGTIWVFCSFMVVWGQHYQFATLMLCFTLGMYFLQLYLEQKKQGIYLVLALAAICLAGYYYLYLCGIFYAIYSVVWCEFQKVNWREIVKKLVGLAGNALFGCAVAAINLIPSLQDFFASTRIADVTGVQRKVALIYDKEYLFTFLGRLFSADMLKAGNDYTGAYNYYEAALLSTSILSFFAVIFLLHTKYKKRVAGIGAGVCFSLLFPLISQIWNMNPLKQRWSYIICFLEVLAISYAMGFLVEEIKEGRIGQWKQPLRKTVVWTDILCILILCCLIVAHKQAWIGLDKKIFIIVCIFIFMYSVLLFFGLSWGKRGMVACVYMLVLAELFVMNDSSINGTSRHMLTVTEWESGYYNDGTIEAVNSLSQLDSSLYRVNKTYYSVGENDAMVQGYNGLMVYSSLNSAELVEFYLASGYELIDGFPHWLSIPCYDFYLNSLLGTKYIVAHEGEVTESEEYTLVVSTDAFVVYKNNFALPFGYLYHKQLDKEEVLSLERVERQKALTYGFYMTEEGSGGIKADEMFLQEIIASSHEDILVNLKELQEGGMSDINLTGNEFSGEIENSDMQDAMLAIPIIYDKNWKIYVDGERQNLYNINGGICGTWIGPGKHSVNMVYEKPLENLAVVISLISLCLFIFVNIWYFKRY